MPARRGFALLTPQQRHDVAVKGAKAAHRSGRAHQWTREEARLAGAKGGKAPKRPRRRRDKLTQGGLWPELVAKSLPSES